MSGPLKKSHWSFFYEIPTVGDRKSLPTVGDRKSMRPNVPVQQSFPLGPLANRIASIDSHAGCY